MGQCKSWGSPLSLDLACALMGNSCDVMCCEGVSLCFSESLGQKCNVCGVYSWEGGGDVTVKSQRKNKKDDRGEGAPRTIEKV